MEAHSREPNGPNANGPNANGPNANGQAAPGQICTTMVPLPADLVERDRCRRSALRVADLPGIAPVVAARIVPAGVEVDQSVPAGAHPALACTTSRQALDLLAPAARGLALLHDAGLTHGPGAALWVGLDGSGMLVGWSGQGDPAADVAVFATLAFAVLPAGAMGSDVVQALVLAGDPDPHMRPTASRLATVFDAARRREAVHAAHVPGTPPPALPTSPAAVRRSAGVWGSPDDEAPAIGGSPFVPPPWGARSESPAQSPPEPSPDSPTDSPPDSPTGARTRHRRAESRRRGSVRPARVLAGVVGGIVVLAVAWVAWPSSADQTPMCPLMPDAAVVEDSPNPGERTPAKEREKNTKPRAKNARG